MACVGQSRGVRDAVMVCAAGGMAESEFLLPVYWFALRIHWQFITITASFVYLTALSCLLTDYTAGAMSEDRYLNCFVTKFGVFIDRLRCLAV